MKTDFERTSGRAGDDAGPLPAPAKYPVLTLDVSLYEEFLAGSDMTDDQKREFIEALWSIVVGFVDLGFGIHPVQQVDAGADGLLDGQDGSPNPILSLPHESRQDHGESQSLRTDIEKTFSKKEET